MLEVFCFFVFGGLGNGHRDLGLPKRLIFGGGCFSCFWWRTFGKRVLLVDMTAYGLQDDELMSSKKPRQSWIWLRWMFVFRPIRRVLLLDKLLWRSLACSEARRGRQILCMSAVAAGLVAKSRLFGASFAGATRGISSRNALRPGGALLAYDTLAKLLPLPLLECKGMQGC